VPVHHNGDLWRCRRRVRKELAKDAKKRLEALEHPRGP
jgi:hypothetical protein